MQKKDCGEELLQLRPLLQHYATCLTCSKERAEDLLQDTLLKTLEQAEKFKEGTNFRAWTFTIMYNLFINDLKKWSRVLFISDIGLLGNTKNRYDEYNFWDPVSLYDIQAAIEEKLREMSEEDRKIWQLYGIGYRYEEISQITGIVLGTVKSKIYTIRRKLRCLFC